MGLEWTDDEMNRTSGNESPISTPSEVTDSAHHRDGTSSIASYEQPNAEMIVDEIPTPTNSQSSDGLRNTHDNLESQDPAHGGQRIQGNRGKKGNTSPQKVGRKRPKAEEQDLLSSPDKILLNVLSKSQFKVPNLSHLVVEKFNAPDFQLDISNELKDITYDDTTLKVPMIDKSVLPTQFEWTHTVNVAPSAITMLTCIHEVTKRRERFRKGKKNGNKPRENGGGAPYRNSYGAGGSGYRAQGRGRGRGGFSNREYRKDQHQRHQQN